MKWGSGAIEKGALLKLKYCWYKNKILNEYGMNISEKLKLLLNRLNRLPLLTFCYKAQGGLSFSLQCD